MSGWWSRFSGRILVVRSLFKFLWEERLWWMIPMVTVLLLFGFLLFIGLQTPFGPFIYTLF